MEAFIKQFSLKIVVSEAFSQRCYKASFMNSYFDMSVLL